MPAKQPEVPRALTAAERQARRRVKRAAEFEGMRKALKRIVTAARTVQEAREIAASALGS